MADNTINYGFPYPTGGDRVAVHSDIEKVAVAVDAWGGGLDSRVEDAQWKRGLALPGMDYKTAPGGVYYIASGSLAESLGMPRRAQGWLTIIPSPQGQRFVEFRQTDIISSTSLEVWAQTTDHTGAWNRPWHQIYPAPAQPSGVSHRHQILSDDQFNAVGGVVHTDGATPVALTWDDWPADTRDLVVPMLRARGIKATLALPSRILTPERAPHLGGEGITWPEIDAWVAEGIFEIANHSATHMGASTPEGLRDEIETALDELHAHLPSAKVRCWIQPSVNYPDFNNGNSLDAWTRTEAGQLILDNHALATGLYRREPGVFSDPRLGRPVQGTGRTWIDAGTSSAQAAIQALAGTDRGIIIGAHANRLTIPDRTTPAQLEAFLDWLVAEQDAGRVRLLTLSEWAWADARPAPEPPESLADYYSGQRILPLENGATGTAYIQRTASEIELYIRDLNVPGDGKGTFLTIPAGFRTNRLPLYGLLGRTGARQLATFDIGPGHSLSQGTAHTSGMYMHFKWSTDDPIPTTLPGTPA